MSRYEDLTTKGRSLKAWSHRVGAGSRTLGTVQPRVVKSPQSLGPTTLVVPGPRFAEFYAH